MVPVTRLAKDLCISALMMTGEFELNEMPEPNQIAEALYWLNLLIDTFSSNGALIAFETQLDFMLTANKRTYTISNNTFSDIHGFPFVSLKTANITWENVVYPVDIYTPEQINFHWQIDNVKNLPAAVVFQRTLQETQLQFWPIPILDFNIFIRGKAYLANVDLNTDMSIVPSYYHRPLIYGLTKDLCPLYGSNAWTPAMNEDYERSMSNIIGSNDSDNTLKPQTELRPVFYNPNRFYWQGM